MSATNQIVHVPFNGQTVDATLDEKSGTWLVALKPICENIGVDYSGQLQRLKNQPWATMGVIPTVASNGKTYEMAAIDRQTFVMWLATIDASRLKSDAARAVVLKYQMECAKVLDSYFFGASLPRTREERMAVALLDAKSMLDEARGHIAEMEPRAALGDAVSANGQDTYTVTQAARYVAQLVPSFTRQGAFELLRRSRMLCKGSCEPTREGIDVGRVVAVRSEFRTRDGQVLSRQHARLTGKGLSWLVSRALEGAV